MGVPPDERLHTSSPLPRSPSQDLICRSTSCAELEGTNKDACKRKLAASAGSLRKKRKVQKGPLRAVLFDFDATLTLLDGLEEHRLFPKLGGSGAIDVTWLREKAFGGEGRIHRLGATLQTLAASGAELHIVSLADRMVIVRALAILGALHFFCDRIIGWQELGSPYNSKAPYIKTLMEEKNWLHDEVLFVDDQERNLEEACGLCLTHRTWGRGLCVEELEQLQRRVAQASGKENVSGKMLDLVID
jgi:hypothetical protein